MAELILNQTLKFRLPVRWAWLILAGIAAGCSETDAGDTGGDPTDNPGTEAPTEPGDTSQPPTSSPDPTPDATPSPSPDLPPDRDGDGVLDSEDNCPDDENANQSDVDNDGSGDVCSEEVCDGIDNDGDDEADNGFVDTDDDGDADCVDLCPLDPENDEDEDGFCAEEDVCPLEVTATQDDSDGDGLGDECDNCLDAFNADQEDTDFDGIGDDCDTCPLDATNDPDGDSVCNNLDNCVSMANPGQEDHDKDLLGDDCDACDNDPDNDADADGICGDLDNCPSSFNTNQMDRDLDGSGDACDSCPDDNPDNVEDGSCGDVDPNADPDGALFIYGMYPDTGYQAVPLDFTGKLYLSSPYGDNNGYPGSEEAIHVTLISEHADESPQVLPVVMTADGLQARFYPNPDLRPNSDYCLVIDIDYQESVDGQWPLRYSGCFTTRIPCGTPVDVGYNAVITDLGDTSKANLAVLNGYLTASAGGNNFPVALLLEDIYPTDVFPLVADVELGAYESNEDETGYQLRRDGYSSTFYDCAISSAGAFTCTADSAIFPIYVEEYNFKMNIYVDDVEMSSSAISSGQISTMDNFLLKGIITQESLDRIEYETGYPITALVTLNLDLDEDGTLDAATFELETEPRAVTIDDTLCPSE